MLEVAFDESGNSGQNLLDRIQPVYTLASVARPESEVAPEVAALLDGSDFDELKFSDMRGSEPGRRLISNLFDAGLLDPAHARVVPVDKDWMVAGKMVDLLWEPQTPDSNAFYASGVHRRIASALQRQGPAEAGPEVWERWQRAFVAAVRRPQDEARIAALAATLAALKVSAQGQPIGILLEVVPDDEASLAALIPHGDDELDPALGGLVEQLHHWSQRLGKPFKVVHDDSAVVRRWQQLLERLSDQENPRRTFDIGDIHFDFPLYGVEVGTVDSRHTAAVQLADVLAGAVMWCLREKLRGHEVPEQWREWELGRFIDFFQGADDFLLGLVDPGQSDQPAPPNA